MLFMGIVYSEIMLKNAGDVINAQREIIPEQQVRAAAVNALVDTGAGTLVINEEIRQKLGLTIEGLRRSTLANGISETYQVTEPVKIYWKDRDCVCRPILIPGTDGILLGTIPLEDMDLIVDPQGQQLVGAHGDEVMCLIK
jgi:clan AA aspartic protease